MLGISRRADDTSLTTVTFRAAQPGLYVAGHEINSPAEFFAQRQHVQFGAVAALPVVAVSADTVTLEVICSSDIVDGKWTFRLDDQIVTVRLDLDEIKKVVPFDPSSIYDRVF